MFKYQFLSHKCRRVSLLLQKDTIENSSSLNIEFLFTKLIRNTTLHSQSNHKVTTDHHKLKEKILKATHEATQRCGGITVTSMNRTAEQTSTQNLTIKTMEKQDYTNAKMWWWKFVQNIIMTIDVDLSTMTNNKEILSYYRNQLETEI